LNRASTEMYGVFQTGKPPIADGVEETARTSPACKTMTGPLLRDELSEGAVPAMRGLIAHPAVIPRKQEIA
jgi:hypothetical protein